MTELETSRLFLRPYVEADAPFTYELLNSPPWLKYIGDRGVRNIEDAKRYIREKIVKSYAINNMGMCAVVEKSSEKTIGSCGLVKRDFLPHPDLGFAFLPGYEGKGYGFESASAVVDFSKNKLKLKRLLAITLEINLASIGLLKKLGFEFQKNVTFEDGGEELQMYFLELK